MLGHHGRGNMYMPQGTHVRVHGAPLLPLMSMVPMSTVPNPGTPPPSSGHRGHLLAF